MTIGNWRQIWVEQCAAAETIKLRHGLKAAFDYAVAEKLLNFAEAAAQHPEFARELPRFVSRGEADIHGARARGEPCAHRA